MNTLAWVTLSVVLAVGLIWSSAPHVIAFFRQLKDLRGMKSEGKPMWLRYKPTGKVLYLPAHYESEAIDELIRGLKEIPEGIPLNSPLFERFATPPVPAAPVTV